MAEIADAASFPQAATLPDIGAQGRCSELKPFNRDEQIWWAFRCGLEKSLGRAVEPRLVELHARLRGWGPLEVAGFVGGYYAGLAQGGKEALTRYQKSTADFVRDALLLAKDSFSTVYDWQTISDMYTFLQATPGVPEQAEALRSLADTFRKDHPEFANAFRLLALGGTAVEALVDWLETDPDARSKIAVALFEWMGEVLGAEADQLLRASGDAYALGSRAGMLVGNVVGEIVLLIYGF